jgi:uncharacterized repeat protein (TIGR01451 family)
MEGNKPDNSSSTADSISLKDEEDIIISGQQSYDVGFWSGIINNKETRNGVEGNYINFGVDLDLVKVYSYVPGAVGIAYPKNKITISLDMDYYYKDVNSEDDWILLDENTPNATDVINGTEIIAGNVICRSAENFWPDPSKNRVGASGYCGDSGSSYSLVFNNKRYHYSGDMNYTQNIDKVELTNENYWVKGTFSSDYDQVFIDGLELFVPYYKNGDNDYDYKIEIKAVHVNIPNDDGTEFNQDETASYSLILKNRAKGKYTIALTGPTYVYDNTEHPMGRVYRYTSKVATSDGPYEGGLERLLTFDSNLLEIEPDNNNMCISYSYEGIYDNRPPKDNIQFKYGIYKNNNGAGISDDAIINTAEREDFDWYDTKAEAMEHGVISAALILEPDFRGNQVSSSLTIPIIPVNNAENINKLGIIKQKAYLYADAERTIEYEEGANETYRRGTAGIDGGVSNGDPFNGGQTVTIRLAEPVPHINSYNHETGEEDGIFTVEEKYADLILAPELRFFSDTLDLPEKIRLKYTVEVPAGTKYKENSATIAPVSVTNNLITWDFEWDPSIPVPAIKYTLELSPLLATNSALGQYFYFYFYYNGKGSKYFDYTNFKVTNLAGSSMRKTVDKEIIDLNDPIEMTDTIYNISDETLQNVKTIEILPKNGDGSNEFEGTYTIKVSSLNSNQTMYYTTNSVDNIGLVEDSEGNQTIQAVDLANDSRWIQVNVGDTIPANATAIATHTLELAAMQVSSFAYQIITSGNQNGDKYIFKTAGSSDNLSTAIRSDILRVSVVDRKITGKVFEDLNRSDIYNDSDALLKDYTVELLNESGTKIAETTTDTSGYYEFSVGKGKYFIRFVNLPNGYELIPKGTTENHNKVNSTMKTDLINHTEPANEEIEVIGNINLGIRKKETTLTVKYLDKNNDQPLAEETTSTVYYTDPYETHG